MPTRWQAAHAQPLFWWQWLESWSMACGDSRVELIKFGRERAGFIVCAGGRVLEVIYTLSVGEAWVVYKFWPPACSLEEVILGVLEYIPRGPT